MKRIFLVAFIGLTFVSWSQNQNFSTKTVEKFAKAYIDVRNENMSFQLNKITAIEEAGLTSDEFTDIHIQLNNADSKKEPTKIQKRQYDLALENINNLQKDIQKSIELLIQQHGLKIETYHAIAKASQSDQVLKQKIQKLIE